MRTKIAFLKNACRLFKAYLRHPYRLYDTDQFDAYNHQHECLLARVSPAHFETLCPMANRGRFIAGDFDECERCRYFGTVFYDCDPGTGEKQICVIASEYFIKQGEHHETHHC